MNSATTSETTPSFKVLFNELNLANAALRKAVRKAKVPSDFAEEKAAAMKAYRAYWGAVDAAGPAKKPATQE